MKRLALPTIFLACGAILASGCVYKMSIQQGNYLVTDSVSQLKEGMTRSQVRFLLGTPMVPDAFDDSRWDYYYFYSSRKFDQPLKRRLTVYFADERVHLAGSDCEIHVLERAPAREGHPDPGGLEEWRLHRCQWARRRSRDIIAVPPRPKWSCSSRYSR